MSEYDFQADAASVGEVERSREREAIWLGAYGEVRGLLCRLASGRELCASARAMSARMSERLAARIEAGPELERYSAEPTLQYQGLPYYDTVGQPELERAYFQQAPRTIRALRRLLAPYQSPIDQLRLWLDEGWPYGAQALRTTGRRLASVGLARVFGDGAHALAHDDRLEKDAPLGRFRGIPLFQVAVNFYLRVADQGGELHIWNRKLSPSEYDALRAPDSYGIEPAHLGDPDAVYVPRQGDVALFNAQNLHAVQPVVAGGPRVTLSCFIVCFGWDQPLYVYS